MKIFKGNVQQRPQIYFKALNSRTHIEPIRSESNQMHMLYLCLDERIPPADRPLDKEISCCESFLETTEELRVKNSTLNDKTDKLREIKECLLTQKNNIEKDFKS